MKVLIACILILSSFHLFAQEALQVNSGVIDLGEIRETLGGGTKKIVLKLSASSPEEFKVKFNYKYRFVSQEIDNVFVGPSGDLGFSTRSVSSETYDNNSKIVFDISESTAMKGEDLEVLLEISKPNKNTHGIKVEVTLKDSKGNVITGGRKLLGLLGRSYRISAENCD